MPFSPVSSRARRWRRPGWRPPAVLPSTDCATRCRRANRRRIEREGRLSDGTPYLAQQLVLAHRFDEKTECAALRWLARHRRSCRGWSSMITTISGQRLFNSSRKRHAVHVVEFKSVTTRWAWTDAGIEGRKGAVGELHRVVRRREARDGHAPQFRIRIDDQTLGVRTAARSRPLRRRARPAAARSRTRAAVGGGRMVFIKGLRRWRRARPSDPTWL